MTMELLGPEAYRKVNALIDRADFNTLFARTVVDGRLPGKVFVDDIAEPKTSLIAHPYGMSLLVGEPGNRDFNEALASYMLDASGTRNRPEWLQTHPRTWDREIGKLLGQRLLPAFGKPGAGKVVELTRVNFRFNREKFLEVAARQETSPHEIARTTAGMFDAIQGKVIPKYFWRDADQFIGEGAGYSMLVGGRPVSTAFSAFVRGNQLELGIETAEGFRGRGYAAHVCKALIEHCLRNRLEPLWACRLDNAGSFRLAQKLGFEPAIQVPYYLLAHE